MNLIHIQQEHSITLYRSMRGRYIAPQYENWLSSPVPGVYNPGVQDRHSLSTERWQSTVLIPPRMSSSIPRWIAATYASTVERASGPRKKLDITHRGADDTDAWAVSRNLSADETFCDTWTAGMETDRTVWNVRTVGIPQTDRTTSNDTRRLVRIVLCQLVSVKKRMRHATVHPWRGKQASNPLPSKRIPEGRIPPATDVWRATCPSLIAGNSTDTSTWNTRPGEAMSYKNRRGNALTAVPHG